MRLSSIFSFETYAGAFRKIPGRVPAGCLLAIALLLGVEFGIARSDWIWSYVPKSEAGVVDAIEEQVIAEAKDPSLIFMGSSRTRDAVAPRKLEKELGLHEGAVLNLGVTQGTPFDALTLYRRNRAQLSGARMAFIGVEVYQFDKSTKVNERVNRFATFGERMAMYDGSDRLQLLAGSVWRTYDSRRAVRRYIKARWEGSEPEPLPMTKDGRIVWIRRGMGNKRATLRTRKYFKNWEASANRLGILTTLIEELEADGIEVVLFQVPVRRKFWQFAQKRYPDKYAEYYSMVRGVADEREVAFYDWEEAQSLNMINYDFYDYGHMTSRGADKFARILAHTIWDNHRDGLPDDAHAPLRSLPKKERERSLKKKKRKKKKKKKNEKRRDKGSKKDRAKGATDQPETPGRGAKRSDPAQ